MTGPGFYAFINPSVADDIPWHGVGIGYFTCDVQIDIRPSAPKVLWHDPDRSRRLRG